MSNGVLTCISWLYNLYVVDVVIVNGWKHTKVFLNCCQVQFLHMKILTRCVHQSWWQYCEPWKDLWSLELDLINSWK
jgi:hypothetical protein